MPAAVFVSPHLDDVAFSCAEPVLALRECGWEVTLATVFTATVDEPRGFALACQTDKGLAEEVDYMALRRAEDRAFADRLGVACRQLDLPEAPHRGYEDVDALFGDVRDDDPAHREAAEALRGLFAAVPADVCFSPIGIGGHVDHAIVARSLEAIAACRDLVSLRYVDQPYALRYPDAAVEAIGSLGTGTLSQFSSVTRRRREAIDAIAEYTTQIDFQFGDPASMRRVLDETFAGGTPFWHRRGTIDVLDEFVVPESAILHAIHPSPVGSSDTR